MLTRFKFLVIFIALSSITQADRFLIKDQANVECAFRNSLCNLSLNRPCCDIRDICMPSGPKNLFRCIENVGLGKFCYRDDECEKVQHAKCSKNNQCVCRDRNVQISAMACGPLVGEFCWKNESCLTNNAVCIDNECKCKNNYSLRSNDQCIFDVLGAHCEDDSLCQQVRFAKCSTHNNTCQCSSNTIPVNPTYCAAVIGGFCWTKDDCLPLNSVCIDNKCRCDDLYIAESNEKCTLAHLGMSCEENSDCSHLIPFTECSQSKTCNCKKNYFQNNVTRCDLRTVVNEYCIDNGVICKKKNFVCINNYCQCKPNYVYKSSKCNPDRLYESCDMTIECYNIEHAVCSDDKVCVCDKNYTAWQENFCKPVLGGACFEDKDCIAINSVCIDGKCQCKELFFKVSENLCLSQRLGETCVDQSDCAIILNATCTENNVCECMPGYGQYNITTCAPLLGWDCSKNKLCAPVNSVCINNICVCGEGHQSVSDDKCAPIQLAQQCKTNDHCNAIFNSKCVNNFCVCNHHHVIIDGIICAPLLNEYCEENHRCAPKNSICVDHKCQCMEDYSKHFNYKCVSRLGHFQISCDRDDHCTDIKYAECSNDNKCTCKSNYVRLGNDKCIALLGQYCDDDIECISYNTVCIDHKCKCTEKFLIQSKYKCDPILLGSACQRDRDCEIAIKNSRCSEYKFCVCQKNYYVLNEFGSLYFECAPSLNERCLSSDDCRFNFSACIDNQCQCKPGFRSVSENQCQNISSLYTCAENLDCGDPWHTICSGDKKCICNKNNIAINKSTCLPLLKGNCWVNHQCVTKNSKCIDYQCQCMQDFRAVSDNFCMPVNHHF